MLWKWTVFLSSFACFDCIVELLSSNKLFQVRAQYFLPQLNQPEWKVLSLNLNKTLCCYQTFPFSADLNWPHTLYYNVFFTTFTLFLFTFLHYEEYGVIIRHIRPHRYDFFLSKSLCFMWLPSVLMGKSPAEDCWQGHSFSCLCRAA